MRAPLALLLAASLATACGSPSVPEGLASGAAASAVPSAAPVVSMTSPSAVADSSAPSESVAASVPPRVIAACDLLPAASTLPKSARPVHVVLPSSGWAVGQTEIISPAGVRVLTDVASPSDLTKPAIKADILVTTHRHPDHWNDAWAFDFPGETYVGGQPLVRKDVRITAIGASHFGGTIPDGSDTIFVVDVAGMRIVNFGDLGQDALSAAQLALIGVPDLAFSQLSNEYSSMSVANRKGYLLMAQVCPRLFLPTHMMEGDAAAKLAADTWPVTYTTAKAIDLAPSVLPNRMTVILVGANAGLGKTLGLPIFGS